jgi:hypothetical protein
MDFLPANGENLGKYAAILGIFFPEWWINAAKHCPGDSLSLIRFTA